MKLSPDTVEHLILCIGFLAIVLIAFSTWAKTDPAPWCDAYRCASTADTLRIKQIEGVM